jgi:hypothetical protein
MAEYSFEYCEQNEFLEPGDFSIVEIYNSMSEGDVEYRICEGYGITSIEKSDGECWVTALGKRTRFIDLYQKHL